MNIRVIPSIPSGRVRAIASKSVAHRLLICAAFADEKTLIRCEQTNKDIEATAECLSALGASIIRKAPYYEVTPISEKNAKKNALLPCGESGSTLRFLIPIVASLGLNATFLMEGRLPERPLSPLIEELEAHGASFEKKGNYLNVSGKLSAGKYKISGGVSSQFISGLLFGLSLLNEKSTLSVYGKIESAPYIDITVDALSSFGAKPKQASNVYEISACGRLKSPIQADVEGDWSNAAFMLALGVIGKGSVSVTGLRKDSLQGDMEIIKLLKRLGAKIEEGSDEHVANGSALCAASIDASQIPDLVPILATLAAAANGKSVIYGASRLKLKESNRIESVCSMLSALGADILPTDDGMIINGHGSLEGGTVSSFGDHRIAMSAAVAACICKNDVIIKDAEAVQKSYPDFFDDLSSLGVLCKEV